jgi:anti-sigma B factor antagonist
MSTWRSGVFSSELSATDEGEPMGQPTATTMDVRLVTDRASVIDIRGEITAASEDALMDAYARASTSHTRAIILNFGELEYMNSSGIGLLVTLLVRANRQQQRLLVCELNDHYRQIFELTRLNEVIGIHDTEAAAVAVAGA